jgi:hypothetical protein
VNANRPQGHCDAATHAARRRQQSNYCIDCGEELISKQPSVR